MLAGNGALFDCLKLALERERRKRSDAFTAAVKRERDERYQKYGAAIYLQEPNVKEKRRRLTRYAYGALGGPQ
ncbi:MAG: hypothetical protein WKF84_19395 [Pyrinomonadaceae bacterium]